MMMPEHQALAIQRGEAAHFGGRLYTAADVPELEARGLWPFSAQPPADDLESLTVSQLRERAESAGLALVGRERKADLISALRGAN
jgi:hypothetical protein